MQINYKIENILIILYIWTREKVLEYLERQGGGKFIWRNNNVRLSQSGEGSKSRSRGHRDPLIKLIQVGLH